jgi:hypothetical protein
MLAFALLLFSLTPALAGKVKFPKGRVQSAILEKELAPHLQGNLYTEGWSLWSWDNKGWSVYAMLMVSKVHPWVGVRTGVQLTIRSPKGQIFHKLVEFDKRALKRSRKKMTVKIKGHMFKGTQKRGRLKLKFAKASIDLRYKRLLPALRHFGGTLKVGSQKVFNLAFAPRVEVTGKIRFGKKTIRFNKANGYADRSWQTAPHQIARRWLNLRLLGKKYTIIASHLKPAKGYSPTSIPTLSIARGKDWLFHGNQRSVQFKILKTLRDKETGYRVPLVISLKGKLSKTRRFHIKIQRIKRYQRLDVLAHLHGFLRFFVKKLITNPYLFRSKVKATLSIFEGTRLVEKREIPGLAESVFLNH